MAGCCQPGCPATSKTFPWQFMPVFLNALSTSSRDKGIKRAVGKAGALINAVFSWQMPVLSHE